jgi:leader peptidase (prepilin peptidase)/N-methyltransferase
MLGLVMTAVVGGLQGGRDPRALLLDHLLAAGVGLLVLEGLSGLGALWLGRPALGLGDAKLAALIGAWLGLVGLALTLVLAIALGALVGSLARLSGRLGPFEPFPFGPFLAAGAVVIWLGGVDPWLAALPPGLGFGS